MTKETFYIINQIPKINRAHWNLPWMSSILKFCSLKISLETLERSLHRGEKTEISREASWDIWHSSLWIKRTIIHICWNFSATPRFDSNVYVVRKTWAKKKTACFCGTYAVRPLQKKNTWTKNVLTLNFLFKNRKFKRQVVVFYTKSIKWYCPFEMFLKTFCRLINFDHLCLNT